MTKVQTKNKIGFDKKSASNLLTPFTKTHNERVTKHKTLSFFGHSFKPNVFSESNRVVEMLSRFVVALALLICFVKIIQSNNSSTTLSEIDFDSSTEEK